ncbi:hypothetical protein FPQ10_06035 [Allobacillus sp. SKP2-8]|uniref:hypothetical protein n=1 Tax=unclassified Allobacillus TaxID=2628859 RepID=UPI00118462E0|nr:hypothetical protein [Allobacillus sp. SKP2-8]TSJ67354.1 hypothetical protein FPQ10_06035 [Allobacillus sp. SKP2-8]
MSINIVEERIKLKSSLKDIRSANKRDDQLFSGMEEVPKQIPEDLYKSQLSYYNDYIRPTVQRVHDRHINK